MRIQCGHAQTRFDPVQCTLGAQCGRAFRKPDFDRLLVALKIPKEYGCVQKTVSTGMEALLILLRRLAYPSRWSDLAPLFGRSESEMSLIFREVCYQFVKL